MQRIFACRIMHRIGGMPRPGRIEVAEASPGAGRNAVSWLLEPLYSILRGRAAEPRLQRSRARKTSSARARMPKTWTPSGTQKK